MEIFPGISAQFGFFSRSFDANQVDVCFVAGVKKVKAGTFERPPLRDISLAG